MAQNKYIINKQYKYMTFENAKKKVQILTLINIYIYTDEIDVGNIEISLVYTINKDLPNILNYCLQIIK